MADFNRQAHPELMGWSTNFTDNGPRLFAWSRVPLGVRLRISRSEHNKSAFSPAADVGPDSAEVRVGPQRKVAALQPAARGQEPIDR